MRTDPDLIYQGDQDEMGHGWVERGSSQVIWSSKQEVISILFG